MLRAALLLSSALQQTRAFEWLAQFPDRGAVDPAAANINLTVYQDPEWAQSWCAYARAGRIMVARGLSKNTTAQLWTCQK